MGLEACGWKVAYANDFSVKKYEMYRDFFPDEQHYVVDDIFNIDPITIPYTTLSTCSFPSILMVENVPGLLHSNKGEDFKVAVQALNELGYSCEVVTDLSLQIEVK